MLFAVFARPWLFACATPAPEPAPLPLTANRAAYDEMWADARAPRTAGDGGGRLVWVDPPPPAQARDPIALGLALEVGPEGIAPGGTVTFLPSPFWGWSAPQTADAAAPGWTSLEAPAPFTLRAGDGSVIATVGARGLRAGERVVIRYQGRADRFAEAHSPLWVGVDADGDGVRAILPPLTLPIGPGPAERLVAWLPSTATPGEVVALHLAAVDADGNGPCPISAPVRLSGPPGAATLVDGVAEVPFAVPAPGVWAIDAVVDGLTPASTNPLVARADVVPILWADLHLHSWLSDGSADPAQIYRYARDVAGLDVAAVTDHDHWGMAFLDADPTAQAQIAAATDAAYVPGRFVTAHGYEWTSWAYGHRHVLWFDHPRPWRSSLDPRFDTPAELHAAWAGAPAIVVRHHPAGGPVAIDWSFPIDPALEPVVEISSVHGQSESAAMSGAIYDPVPAAFADRALARGARFGWIGSTDAHDGHPGRPGGLAALEGAERTRASVLATIRARRVYATNGPRIVLRFAVGDTPMGGTRPAGVAEATVRVVGTAPIDHVELVHTRVGVIGSRPGDGSALLYATFPVDPAAGDGVYVRVVQEDGGLAWASPVFFD